MQSSAPRSSGPSPNQVPAPQPSLEQQIKDPNKKDDRNFLQRASHPGVCFTLIFIKVLALVDFLILSFFVDNEALVYLTVIILGAVDFWITKNVAGRKLVGLRWWNEVKENGEEVWIYESKNEKTESSVDKSVFWTCIYASAIGWAILFIYEVITLSLSWALITLAMFVFSVTNTYGYFKCSKDQKSKLSSFGKGLFKSGVKAGMQAATN